ERLEDLPLLAQRILSDAGIEVDLGESTLATLSSYAWPGNVRELKNVLVRAATLGAPPEVPEVTGTGAPAPRRDQALEPFHAARKAMLDRFEREYLLHLLARHQRSVPAAAKEAGVARGHFYRLLKKHGL